MRDWNMYNVLCSENIHCTFFLVWENVTTFSLVDFYFLDVLLSVEREIWKLKIGYFLYLYYSIEVKSWVILPAYDFSQYKIKTPNSTFLTFLQNCRYSHLWFIQKFKAAKIFYWNSNFPPKNITRMTMMKKSVGIIRRVYRGGFWHFLGAQCNMTPLLI